MGAFPHGHHPLQHLTRQKQNKEFHFFGGGIVGNGTGERVHGVGGKKLGTVDRGQGIGDRNVSYGYYVHYRGQGILQGIGDSG